MSAAAYLSLARKAGVLVTGEQNTGVEIRNGRGRLLALAADASDNARRRAEGYIQNHPIPMVVLPLTKEEIANATGKNGCSMVVFTDAGLAAGFAGALLKEYGEEYRQLSDTLAETRDRLASRRKAFNRDSKQGKRRRDL
jgi:ribosomal protein L7Ae-like RNA K-turn-binding protein